MCVCVSTHLFCFLHCADFFLFGVCIAFRNLFYMWMSIGEHKMRVYSKHERRKNVHSLLFAFDDVENVQFVVNGAA